MIDTDPAHDVDASASSCPHCEQLDARVAAIEATLAEGLGWLRKIGKVAEQLGKNPVQLMGALPGLIGALRNP